VFLKTTKFLTDTTYLPCVEEMIVTGSLCIVDARLLESSESYKAASQRASLEVERLRAENEDLKQQLDAG